MLNLLDEILLSENVTDNFYKAYKNTNFKNWLLSFLPEIEECNKLNQDNPWHIYPCLTHILKSVEQINKQTVDLPIKERRMLAYAMLLHDIGKPQTKIRRYAKSYGREVDSYFNHNIKGVEIANRMLSNFNFNKQEELIIKTLIEKHDMFIPIKEHKTNNPYHKVLTYDLIKEEINDLNKIGNGEKLLEYLIMVARSDSLAQNPEMTKEVLKLYDKCETMFKTLTQEKQ